ncbi:carboxypeptidase-like regulatory domain-containing protein [Pedobacter sp. ASV12]|uniref:carboxypeptidase-like regulatory domain-containing protein n=1 Tax=Pedobacter sp. ASV12 TaxID=2795120 RepID=UPI0018EBD7F4|nr:carboxypeptidase-like regulatory domain-containing protein [Pedobacter sp. ASV12]
MKKFTFCLITVLICLSIISCKKNNTGVPDIDPPGVTDADFAKNFGNVAHRDFIGQIVDVTNNPIPGATIKIGASTTQTDANGIFVVKNASVYDRFAFITATKAGYLIGSRTLVPTTGTNQVKIMLLPAAAGATVNTGTTSTVSLANGAKIVFDGAFKTEAGSTYNGVVSVIANYLDPSDTKLTYKMPGMLFAKNTNGDPKLLETYGMLNIELRGSANENLQLANTAQIEFPVATAQQANAPSTIPLWHFDETAGYWKEEGTATKIGNKYVGTVKHFSWWNFDTQLSSVYLSLKLVDANNQPLPNMTTIMVRQGNSSSYPNSTDNNGQASGLVPQNETLTLNVLNACGSIIHTQSVGPLSTNTTLPTIVINSPTIQLTTVSGTLKKCNNNNVTNGYVYYSYAGNNYFSLISNGTFSFQALMCSPTFTMIGQDLDNNSNSGMLGFSFSPGVTNVGNLTTCNTNLESITYSVDNGALKTISANITAAVNGNSFNISGSTPAQLDGITISGNSISPGNYTTASGFQLYGNGLNSQPNQALTQFAISYNLNNVGAVGQYIDISFSGTYVEMVMTGNMMGYNVNHTITGTAHVIRDN